MKLDRFSDSNKTDLMNAISDHTVLVGSRWWFVDVEVVWPTYQILLEHHQYLQIFGELELYH